MRDYQRTKNNPYYLENETYKLTLAFIRTYPRLKETLVDTLEESPAPADGQPRGSGTGDPTANKAANIEPITNDLRIIDDVLNNIPAEYRQAILDSIINFKPYPMWADRSTFWRWKQRFIYEVYEKKFWYM